MVDFDRQEDTCYDQMTDRKLQFTFAEHLMAFNNKYFVEFLFGYLLIIHGQDSMHSFEVWPTYLDLLIILAFLKQ